MVDTPLADMGCGRRPWSVAPSLVVHLLGAGMPDFQGVVASNRPEELALMEDVQEGRFHADNDNLAGQVPTNGEALVSDPNAAIAAHDPGHLGRAGRRHRSRWTGRWTPKGSAALVGGVWSLAANRWAGVAMPSAWCGRTVL
jgi:hypothetical protein